MMTNKIYDILKWIAIIVLPALATFYTAIAGTCNLPYQTEVPTVITAFATLLGTVLGISNINYQKDQKEKTDGNVQ